MLKRVAAIRGIRTRCGGAGIAPGGGAGKALAGSNCASCACPPSAADRSAHARRSSGKSGARKSVDFDSESPICTGESAIRAGEGRLSLLCDLDPGHHSPYAPVFSNRSGRIGNSYEAWGSSAPATSVRAALALCGSKLGPIEHDTEGVCTGPGKNQLPWPISSCQAPLFRSNLRPVASTVTRCPTLSITSLAASAMA